MQYNTSSEFFGVEQIKVKQKWQLDLFEEWASKDQWMKFHSSHYDWWMFPINSPSGYGFAWTVYEGDIFELKKDEVYIRNYIRGVELLAKSWGWNLCGHDYILSPHSDQKWQRWPIRLYKAAQSVQLFSFDDYFASLKKYALDLIQKGEVMNYRGKDLSWLFTTGVDPYKVS
jgi:hypothetical protein